MGSCLAERLSHYVRLSEAENHSLVALEDQDRAYRRGAVVIRENEAPRELFIVRSGWLHSSGVLGNGSRQILRFHFKGDILGLPMLAFADSPETVTAVTEVGLSPFSRETLATLIEDHPRLGALILGLSVAERVALAEDGIIERNGGNQIRLLDEKRLIADSNFIDRTGLETGWLPAAR